MTTEATLHQKSLFTSVLRADKAEAKGHNSQGIPLYNSPKQHHIGQYQLDILKNRAIGGPSQLDEETILARLEQLGFRDDEDVYQCSECGWWGISDHFDCLGSDDVFCNHCHCEFDLSSHCVIDRGARQVTHLEIKGIAK